MSMTEARPGVGVGLQSVRAALAMRRHEDRRIAEDPGTGMLGSTAMLVCVTATVDECSRCVAQSGGFRRRLLPQPRAPPAGDGHAFVIAQGWVKRESIFRARSETATLIRETPERDDRPFWDGAAVTPREGQAQGALPDRTHNVWLVTVHYGPREPQKPYREGNGIMSARVFSQCRGSTAFRGA